MTSTFILWKIKLAMNHSSSVAMNDLLIKALCVAKSTTNIAYLYTPSKQRDQLEFEPLEEEELYGVSFSHYSCSPEGQTVALISFDERHITVFIYCDRDFTIDTQIHCYSNQHREVFDGQYPMLEGIPSELLKRFGVGDTGGSLVKAAY